METWIGRKEWKGIKERLPKGYEWKVQEAKKKNKKGRAMDGDVVMGKEGIGGTKV